MKKVFFVLLTVCLLFSSPVYAYAAPQQLDYTPRTFYRFYSFGSGQHFVRVNSDTLMYVPMVFTGSFFDSQDVETARFQMYQGMYEGSLSVSCDNFVPGVYSGRFSFGLSSFSDMQVNMFIPGTNNLRGLVLPFSSSEGGVLYSYSAFQPLLYEVEARLSDGTSLPVFMADGGLYNIDFNQVYFPALDGSGITFTFRYRMVLTSTMNSPANNENVFRSFPTYSSGRISFTQLPSFSGTYNPDRTGDQTANLIIDSQEKIAESQAVQASAEHQELVNGFDDTAGKAANDKLATGIGDYEVAEEQYREDFTSKVNAYEDPDISDYVSGVSFISSAVVMWWNALGIFKILLLVGFSLIIFNFISRFRGG